MWKKREICIFLCIVTLLIFIPISVKADMGPKPSVIVEVNGFGNETCYATLLSLTPSSGPHHVYTSGETSSFEKADQLYPIWEKFVDYSDPDHYYFLQQIWNCNEENPLQWTYFPPDTFKVLFYFPDTDTFVVTKSCERYAFHSYFTVNLDNMNPDVTKTQRTVSMKQSYHGTWENISLILRVILTILIEIIIALLFHYRDRKSLMLIAVVNVITQIGLNVLLNWLNYKNGTQDLLIDYVLLEIVVTALEAVTYELCMPMIKDRNCSIHSVRVVAVKYALAANFASFVIGFLIAKIVPGLF